MPDYSAFVIAVYVLALVVYGGLALMWQHSATTSEKHIEQQKKSSNTDAFSKS
ncbi:MAG: hypothetical protein HW380_3108 [Magnetococcales bacterium]|nr:hypothetical protein [Magnetococcales bacterium]HIJ83194.1 hypothetical protein [Magnetococcales bacterium]